MYRRSARSSWRRVLLTAAFVAAAAVCALAGEAPAGTKSQQRAVLDLVVNQVPSGQTPVLVRDGDVLLPVSALEAAGIRQLAGRREQVGDVAYVSLASLAPGVTYVLDEKNLTLRVTAKPELFGVTTVDLARYQRPELTFSRANSAFVNYGVEWRQQSGRSLTTEAGLSLRGALATTTFSWTPEDGFGRGLSSIVFDDRHRLRRVVFGDSFAGDRLLGSPLLVGGVRVAREYSVDPYFVQYPMLGLSAAATTPSTVEVYVDGRLVRQERVQPGRFELANVPVPNGSSRTRVLIRDAFGREQEMRTPFYLTSTVLAHGLQEYEYALGFARQGASSATDTYGRLTLLGRHRYGFSDSLTGGVHVEAQSGVMAGGPTVNLRSPVGEFEFGAAGSRSPGQSGLAAIGGYTWAAQPVSVGISARAATDGYRNVSAWQPMPAARRQLSAFLGMRAGRFGTVTMQHVQSELPDRELQRRTSLLGATRLSNRFHLFAGATRLRFDRRTSYEMNVSLSLVLAHDTGATVSATNAGGESETSLDLQRSLPVGSGYGYRVHAGTGQGGSFGGRATYQSLFGRFEAEQESLMGATGTRLSAAGGLVFIGGAVRATRPVQDGFALVRVPGVAGVRGYLSNQEVGRTNRRGDLFIPNLLPYYANRISIADEDVPATRTLSTKEQTVATPYRGGALVVFSATEVHAITGTVRLAVGKSGVVPEFGTLALEGRNYRAESPIGRGGRYYFEQVPPGRYRATLSYMERSCGFTLDVRASREAVAKLGTSMCKATDAKERD